MTKCYKIGKKSILITSLGALNFTLRLTSAFDRMRNVGSLFKRSIRPLLFRENVNTSAEGYAGTSPDTDSMVRMQVESGRRMQVESGLYPHSWHGGAIIIREGGYDMCIVVIWFIYHIQ